MFLDLLLPTVEDLTDVKTGQKVLDLGTGHGIVARRLARPGVEVTATDYSNAQIQNAKRRTERSGKTVTFEQLDLLSAYALDEFARRHAEYVKDTTSSVQDLRIRVAAST